MSRRTILEFQPPTPYGRAPDHHIPAGAKASFQLVAQGIVRTHRLLVQVDWVAPRDVIVEMLLFGSELFSRDPIAASFFSNKIPDDCSKIGEEWFDDEKTLHYVDAAPGITITLNLRNDSASTAHVRAALVATETYVNVETHYTPIGAP